MRIPEATAFHLGMLSERLAALVALRRDLTPEAVATMIAREQATRAELEQIKASLRLPTGVALTIVTDASEHPAGTVLDTLTGQPWHAPPALHVVGGKKRSARR